MANWIFSNKKAAEFEMTPMLMGNANPMDEDGMAFIQANSSSTGRIAASVQYPLSSSTKLSGELQMMDGTMAMTMGAFGVQQDWADCHLQYQYQAPIHTLSFMHSITRDLTLGF